MADKIKILERWIRTDKTWHRAFYIQKMAGANNRWKFEIVGYQTYCGQERNIFNGENCEVVKKRPTSNLCKKCLGSCRNTWAEQFK